MTIPVVEAPHEGESQAAYLVQQKKVWGVASLDYDSLLFGSPVWFETSPFQEEEGYQDLPVM